MHTPAKEDIRKLKTTIGHVPKIALNSSPFLLVEKAASLRTNTVPGEFNMLM